MEIDLHQLPIPDWDLFCPNCRFPLRGLPQPRCPECGTTFDVADLVCPWTRLRDPLFTGQELPVPDFGIDCEYCGAPLADAAQPYCPACAAPFNLENYRPQKPWFLLDAELCEPLPMPAIQARLAQEYVPHVVIDEKTIRDIYVGQDMTRTRLRIPSEFYFDVRWLIQRVREEIRDVQAAEPGAEWTCPHCGEENPAHFEVCWNCQAARDN